MSPRVQERIAWPELLFRVSIDFVAGVVGGVLGGLIGCWLWSLRG